MQRKPYLIVLAPTEKHNFDHQRTPNQQGKPPAMSNSHLPKLSGA